jgi:dienelactone hydrolase
MKFPFLMVLLLASAMLSAQSPWSIATDPAVDQKNPAAMVEIAVPSHGVQLLGALYLAAGAGPHPTVIIYHGFPGFEQNLDLAQALRRDGHNVLAVHYRGSWGMKGDFSYSHAIEDADAEVQWITQPDIAAKYRVDLSRIIVIGHSLGGYMALSAIAHNPKVSAAVLIPGRPIGHRFADLKPEDREKAIAAYASKANPVEFLALNGTSPEALGTELFDHRHEWDFNTLAPSVGKRSVLLVTATFDSSGPNSEALFQTLKQVGSTQSAYVEIKTDHPYSDHRIALETAIINWLDRQGF